MVNGNDGLERFASLREREREKAEGGHFSRAKINGNERIYVSVNKKLPSLSLMTVSKLNDGQ